MASDSIPDSPNQGKNTSPQQNDSLPKDAVKPVTQGENAPSRVLHLRNLPEDATEPELFQLVSQYGSVAKVLLLPKTRQGFVQFQTQAEATAMLEFTTHVPIYFRTKRVFVQYSNRTEIHASPVTASEETETPNRVLLVTISNALYPITVHVLTQVFEGYGTLEKIVVFVKGAGVQALVQFAEVGMAVYAKHLLDEQYIYSECCQLHIQFSSLPSLSVKYNNDKTRDFTNPSLPTGAPEVTNLAPQPPTPGMSIPPTPSMYAQSPMVAGGGWGMPVVQPGAAPTLYGDPQQTPGCVVLVNQLDEQRANLDVLFNLFSTCGIVQRIKILFQKRDTALIQFASHEHADLARNCLSGCPLFGKSLLVAPSRHVSLQGKAGVDGGDSLFGDFVHSGLHRFKAGVARITPTRPSMLLHVSNLPAEISKDEVEEFFKPHGPLRDFKFILPRTPVRGVNDRKMALIQLPSTEQAVEALCLLHNTPVFGIRMRVSFSTSAPLPV